MHHTDEMALRDLDFSWLREFGGSYIEPAHFCILHSPYVGC